MGNETFYGDGLIIIDSDEKVAFSKILRSSSKRSYRIQD